MNMNDLLSRLTALETETVQESLSDHDANLVDSWYDHVVDALDHYEVDGPLSPEDLKGLAQAITNDLGGVDARHGGPDFNTVRVILQNHLEQQERDREEDGPQDSSDDAYALASAGHGDDSDYGTYDEDMGEEFVACVIDFDQSGQAKVSRTKPVSKERAEEIIAGAKAKDKFTNPLFKTIYPASAGKLDAESIMAKYPDLSKTESAEHGDETISPIHGGQKEQPTMENLNLESLRYLSGINNTINECGIPTAMGTHTPASINITAGSGSELTGMLKDIMNLAGVHKVEPQHMPIDVLAAPSVAPAHADAGPDMATLIKAVGEPEADTDSMNDHEEETDEGSGEREGNRPWDSSPHEKIRQDGVRKFGDQNSGSGKGRTGVQPNAQTTESIAEQLYADYKAFVAEAAADEPEAPDAAAVARKKKLDAIKDRQEDDRSEKAYKTDSNVRVHHAKYDNDVDEGYDTRDAYTKDDPKHPDFKKNYERFKAKNPNGSLADFVALMRKK